MLTTEQTRGQTIYQHGLSVQQHLFDLISHLKTDSDLSDWRLPSWLLDFKEQILANLHSEDVLAAYTLFHDCGKQFCRIVDIDGKVHFPNHAAVSRETYLKASGDLIVSNLIGWDMVLHTESSEEISMRCKIWSIQDAITLLVVALSELHSNSKLFGGIESVSFKSKWKHLERRGKQVCKHFFQAVCSTL